MAVHILLTFKCVHKIMLLCSVIMWQLQKQWTSKSWVLKLRWRTLTALLNSHSITKLDASQFSLYGAIEKKVLHFKLFDLENEGQEYWQQLIIEGKCRVSSCRKWCFYVQSLVYSDFLWQMDRQMKLQTALWHFRWNAVEIKINYNVW